MSLRYYANAPATTLNGSVTNVAGSIIVASATGFPISYPYTLILDRGTATEEAVSVTAAAGTTLTVTRAIDGTTAFAHSSGATVEHGITAQDIRESNAHVNASSGVHGLTGSVVGTTDTQTLTNKTLTSPVVSGGTFSGSLKFGSSILDTNGNTLLGLGFVGSAVNFLSYQNAITATNPQIQAAGTDTNIGINLVPKGTGVVQANGITVATISGTQVLTNKDLTSGTNTFPTSLVTLTGSQTLTNKTLTSPTLTTPTIDTLAGVTGVGQRQYVNKGADQSVTSSTTYTADAVLTLPVVANATYILDYGLRYTCSAAGGCKAQLTLPTGATAGAANSPQAAGPVTLIAGAGGATTANTSNGVGVTRIITAGTAGSITVQFAQEVSDATSTVGKANSFLMLTRIA